MIRVCYLIDRLLPAGTESQLLALIRNLDRRRVQPYLSLLDGQDELSRSLEPACCPVLRLGVRSLHHPRTLVKAWQFGRFLRSARIDVLQTYYQDSTYFGVPIARLAGVGCVVRTRNNLGYWMTPVHRWLARGCNRFIDVMVANCEACRIAVAAEERLSLRQVEVVENGIDLGRFAAHGALKATWPRTGAPRIGLVANLRTIKDPETFVRAAALVARHLPGATFHVAGRGELRDSLERLAVALGLGDSINFLGTVTDVPAFLATIDIAVLSSRSEGMSNALLEYMASGRAIVATAVGGNVHLIEDGVNGLLVPPASPERLARAIEQLLGDPHRAERLAASAQELARQRHSLQTRARRFETLYETVIAGGR